MFSFNYEHGDEHIKEIEVDTTQLGVHYTFADNSYTDDFDFMFKGVQLPTVTHFRHFTKSTSGRGCTSVTYQPNGITVDEVPVLTGFRLKYSSDHHIDTVKVRFSKITSYTYPPEPYVKVETCFNDKNNDDYYSGEVQFALVPGNKIYATGDTGNEFDSGGLDPSRMFSSYQMSQGDVALQGFYFDFRNKDHHINRIKVDPTNDYKNNGIVKVNYEDDNYDDDYYWRVWGAIIEQ